MPEINHKDQQSIPAQAPVAATPTPKAQILSPELENQIKQVLENNRLARVEAEKPKEPDWSKLTESQAMAASTYIPVIEHDIPDYMNIKLKNTEYEAVWASRDQRRLGQLLAEGYEFITPEMMAAEFKVPLVFDSDKHYIYQDVIAMRVHKRILYGKRRKALEISQRQLKNVNRPPKTKTQMDDVDFDIDLAQGMTVYDAR